MPEANIKISGGRLIDPCNRIDALLDVFIADGRIAAIGAAPDGFSQGKHRQRMSGCSGRRNHDTVLPTGHGSGY